MKLTCWDTANLKTPLASADRERFEGPVRVARSGFAVDLAATNAPSSLLCETRSEGPARIRVERWDTADFATAVAAFHRSSGLLEGGTLILAAFVLLTAVVSREWLYVLFAAWLVANLRLAAISAGWDNPVAGACDPAGGESFRCARWHRRLLPADHHAVRRLFDEDLTRAWRAMDARPVPVVRRPADGVRDVAPCTIYLPMMWVSVTRRDADRLPLIRILTYRAHTVAMWYGAGLAVTLVSGLYEVLAAAFGTRSDRCRQQRHRGAGVEPAGGAGDRRAVPRRV